MTLRPQILVALLLVVPLRAFADPPVASYIFPAGGQRGKTVQVRVGGLNLGTRCAFELIGDGIRADATLQPTKTIWFEGPLLHLPESQQAEDYPRDMAGKIEIASDAVAGIRYCQMATSEGATNALRFQVGELPEIVEEEIDGDPVPVKVTVPVTINGRIFPRQNIDIWAFDARKGQTLSCEVCAARLGSPLDSYLELYDPHGHKVAENDDYFGADSCIRFTAADDGLYQIRIRDVNFRGGQAFVYRLTITDGPQVDFTYPLGGRRGTKVKLNLHGVNLPAEPVEVLLPQDAPQQFTHTLPLGGKGSVRILLDVEDLPEHVKQGPMNDPEKAPVLAVPAVLNGCIDKAGDVDWWAFNMTKGQVLELDLKAARLGSLLNGVLTVQDLAGKEQASSAKAAGDPTLQFTAPGDGVFRVRVADCFQKRGGPGFGYRLRVAAPAPDFALQLETDGVTVLRGGAGKLKVTAKRGGGFSGPIDLVIDGLPQGVTATGTTIAANQPATEIVLKADANAKVQHLRLSIRGTNKEAGARTAITAAPRGTAPLAAVMLAVAEPTPFKIVGEYDMRWVPRGTMVSRKYRIERNGYEGALEVRLADRQARHLQGVTGPTITVPPGATEFEYTVTLPPWMETARTSRTCVVAIGIVKDKDGIEHEVSFTSLNQNEQVVAVVEPGRLDLEPTKDVVVVSAGGSYDLKVKLLRGKGLQGAAKLELILPQHIRGITAEALTVPAELSESILRIRFDKEHVGPLNAPAIVRATVVEGGRPVVAEVHLALLPPK